MRETHIYGLCNPGSNQIMYVGKADDVKRRLESHMAACEKLSSPKDVWLKGLKTDGVKPEVVILETCEESAWRARESHWIDHCRKLNENLKNATHRIENNNIYTFTAVNGKKTTVNINPVTFALMPDSAKATGNLHGYVNNAIVQLWHNLHPTPEPFKDSVSEMILTLAEELETSPSAVVRAACAWWAGKAY